MRVILNEHQEYAVEDLERLISAGEARPCRYCEDSCDAAPCEQRIDAHLDALREDAEDAQAERYLDLMEMEDRSGPY